MDKGIINRRIAQLEQLAKKAVTERARYAPYSEVRVRSITRNKADVVYHPRGNYGTSEKTDNLTLEDAFTRAEDIGARTIVHLEGCPKWLYCLVMSTGYIESQKQRYTEKFREEHPEAAWLCDLPEAIELIAMLPQAFTLN